MLFTISLTEYQRFHPDTAEVPTLSQSGALAALLQRRRFQASRLALRQARWHAVRAGWERWWARLRRPASRPAEPTVARTVRHL